MVYSASVGVFLGIVTQRVFRPRVERQRSDEKSNSARASNFNRHLSSCDAPSEWVRNHRVTIVGYENGAPHQPEKLKVPDSHERLANFDITNMRKGDNRYPNADKCANQVGDYHIGQKEVLTLAQSGYANYGNKCNTAKYKLNRCRNDDGKLNFDWPCRLSLVE